MLSLYRQVQTWARIAVGSVPSYGFAAHNVGVRAGWHGQYFRARFQTVRAPSLLAPPSAVKNTQTGVVTPVTANQQGRYVAPDFLVGTYDVQAQMKGFQTQIHSGIVVKCRPAMSVVDFSLTGRPTGRNRNCRGRHHVRWKPRRRQSRHWIGPAADARNLPLNGRDFEQLILLAPGVQSVTTGAQSSFYGREPSYSIAGSRPEGQELLLDGANIQGFWNHGAGNSIIGTSLGVEAIGEFQVLTNSYSARFGGSGSVMNATTQLWNKRFSMARVYDFLPQQRFRCP